MPLSGCAVDPKNTEKQALLPQMKEARFQLSRKLVLMSHIYKKIIIAHIRQRKNSPAWPLARLQSLLMTRANTVNFPHDDRSCSRHAGALRKGNIVRLASSLSKVVTFKLG